MSDVTQSFGKLGNVISLEVWKRYLFRGLETGAEVSILDSRHKKVVRFSALHTGRFYPPRDIPGTHFCVRMDRTQGRSSAGRIKSMKNPNDLIGNRTRDLPACSGTDSLYLQGVSLR